MSSLSPNDNARRKSPRKSAGQMPHYLARETIKQKGGGGKKKSGGGVKKRAEKESDLSSDDDSDSDASGAKQRKKTRVATGGRKSDVTKSIGVSRILKAKTVRKSGVDRFSEKGKKTLNYGSDDFSSSSNDTTPKATMGGGLNQEIAEENQREGQDYHVFEVRAIKIKGRAIKIKGDHKNDQGKGARGVEVDRRGDELCRLSESLLSALSFSKIQVPQGWMEGNSARSEEQLLFTLYAPFSYSQRS